MNEIPEKALHARINPFGSIENAEARDAARRVLDQLSRQRPMTNERQLREFCGYLSGALPELHNVEIPRLAEALERYLAIDRALGGPEPGPTTDLRDIGKRFIFQGGSEYANLLADRLEQGDRCQLELSNIVNAKRFDRKVFESDTAFADWAVSRARWALNAK